MPRPKTDPDDQIIIMAVLPGESLERPLTLDSFRHSPVGTLCAKVLRLRTRLKKGSVIVNGMVAA